MTTLPDFEADLRDALEPQLKAQAEAIGQTLKDTAEENFKSYASENDYDIQHIWQDAELIVERASNGYVIRVEWPGLTALFEWGVDPHTIEGNPLLHFYWDAKDTWIKTESVNWGSETGGIPESRSIRGALDYVRFEMEGRVEL